MTKPITATLFAATLLTGCADYAATNYCGDEIQSVKTEHGLPDRSEWIEFDSLVMWRYAYKGRVFSPYVFYFASTSSGCEVSTFDLPNDYF